MKPWQQAQYKIVQEVRGLAWVERALMAVDLTSQDSSLSTMYNFDFDNSESQVTYDKASETIYMSQGLFLLGKKTMKFQLSA